MKYLKKDNKKSTIKEDLLYLLSQFSTSKICNSLCVTITKLDLVTSTGINELPLRKPKLIEFFSKLIYDDILSWRILQSQLKGTYENFLKSIYSEHE
jgi:hypothetical protein